MLNIHPDGTTALAVAIGRLNVEIIKALVSSEGVVNSERNRYLAKVSISLGQVPLKDSEKKDIMSCCKMKPPYVDGSSHGECYKDFLWYPEWVYPYFNEESEYTLGRLNRSITDQMMSLGKKKIITTEDCTRHILGSFCIRSPKGSWAISDDLLLNQECTHTDAKRYH